MTIRGMTAMGIMVSIFIVFAYFLYEDTQQMVKEDNKKTAFCKNVWNTEYDEVALSDIDTCESWWIQAYSTSPPPCPNSFSELETMDSWPVSCVTVGEEMGINPPDVDHEKQHKEGDFNIHDNDKVVVE